MPIQDLPKPPSLRKTGLLATALAAAQLLALSGRAAAQEPTPLVAPVPAPAEGGAEPGVDVPSDADQGGGKKKKKRAAEATGTDGAPSMVAAQAGEARIELRGRVFAAAIYEDQDVVRQLGTPSAGQSGLALTVTSARFGVAVDVLDFVSLQIEAELAGSRARLRDGFLQAKKKRWMVRGGQFKMPISVFTLESPWKLPLARRGWLHELLSDHLILSGRREGFMGQLSGGGSWDPALTVGAFRSIFYGGDNAGDALPGLKVGDQTLVGRLSVTPGGVEIAAVGQKRVTFVENLGLKRYWAGGLESTGDFEFERTAVRFWAEGIAGQSFMSFDAASRATVNFMTGRALAGWRWGGLESGTPYVEPFATVGVLDPDSATSADAYLEIMAGVNVGHWRRTRLTVQFEYGTSGRNFPQDLFLLWDVPHLVNHRAAILQAGAAF